MGVLPAMLCGDGAGGKGGRDSQPKGLWGPGMPPAGITKRQRQSAPPAVASINNNHSYTCKAPTPYL